MRFGIHMPQKGGFKRNVERAVEIGCQSLQIFMGNPTSWKPPALNSDELQQRAKLLEKHDLYPLVVHAPYLVNLSSAKAEFHQKSRQLLQDTMERASHLASPYVVVHMGSHGGAGFKKGMKLFIATLQEEYKKWPPGLELLLENTAGGGTSLGGSFIAIGNIIKALPEAPLGLCLDTAHAWAAGYDLSTPEGLERAMSELDQHVGRDLVKVIHFNDTSTPRGSHRDRHAHLGEGLLGTEGMKMFLARPWPVDLPVILETPGMGSSWDAINMSRLRSFAAVNCES